MGWQDAPIVEEPKAAPKWQQAPEVGNRPPAIIDYSPVAGVAEAVASLATGAAGAAVGGLAGLGQAATNALGLTDTPAADRVRQVSDAITYAPRTKAGEVVTDAATLPFELIAKGAEKAGELVQDHTPTALAPNPQDRALLATGANTAIQALPMLLGRGARALPKESPAAVAERAKAQSLNAPVDEGVAIARDAGLKITPTNANAGVVPRAIESISGQARLEKLLSRKNAPVVNDLIRKDIGLPDNVPLSRDALAGIRAEAGKAYEAVKDTGRFGTDAKFKADLYEINRAYDTASKDFAHRSENPFKKTMEGLNVKNMDAASAVEEVKLLRADADKAYRAGDSQLGKAFKRAAEALDDQLDRHLKRHASATADPAIADAVAKYQAARVRIAKTYAAEKALVESTGNIDASKYAKALKDGKPLSGEAQAVAKVAQQFPRSMQPVERVGATGPTLFDMLLGGSAGVMGTALGGAPGATALGMSVMRPGARAALATGPVQNALTASRTYGPSKARRLQDILSELSAAEGAVGTAAGNR